MKLVIHTSNKMTAGEKLTIERLVRLGLTRFTTQLRHVQVAVRDQNGPKGGNDQRCVLTITPNGLPEIIIQESCPTAEHAVGLAVDRAARNIGRALDRRLRNREYQQRRFVKSFEAARIDTAQGVDPPVYSRRSEKQGGGSCRDTPESDSLL